VIGIQNQLLDRFILSPYNILYFNLIAFLIIIITLFCSATAFAQSTGIQMLPPTGCPLNGTAGVLGWINNGHTALGCINGVNTDGNGGLILNGGLSTSDLSDSGNAVINGSASVGSTVQIGTTDASCSSVNQGTIKYDKTNQLVEYCNGTAWIPLTGSSQVTTTSTTSPSLIIPICSTGQFLTSTDGQTLICQQSPGAYNLNISGYTQSSSDLMFGYGTYDNVTGTFSGHVMCAPSGGGNGVSSCTQNQGTYSCGSDPVCAWSYARPYFGYSNYTNNYVVTVSSLPVTNVSRLW